MVIGALAFAFGGFAGVVIAVGCIGWSLERVLRVEELRRERWAREKEEEHGID